MEVKALVEIITQLMPCQNGIKYATELFCLIKEHSVERLARKNASCILERIWSYLTYYPACQNHMALPCIQCAMILSILVLLQTKLEVKPRFHCSAQKIPVHPSDHEQEGLSPAMVMLEVEQVISRWCSSSESLPRLATHPQLRQKPASRKAQPSESDNKRSRQVLLVLKAA